MFIRNTPFFSNILLDPDQNSGGGNSDAGGTDGNNDEDKTPKDNNELELLKASVAKLESALESERKLKREADQKAADAKKAAEDAAKTTEQKLAERLQNLESENQNLKLERMRAKAIREELSAIANEGLEVDEAKLDSVLSISNLNIENVESVVKTVVSSLAKVKTTEVKNKNSQPPVRNGGQKLSFGQLPAGALTQPLSNSDD